MSTATQTLMTAEEFIRDFGDDSGVELVLGQLVRLPMPGARHGGLAGNAYRLIWNYAEAHDSGRAGTNDAFIRVSKDPPTYRGADVYYISYRSLPRDIPLPDGPFENPPELVVEVKSPTDRRNRMRAKAEEYLAAGVLAVVIIDPELEMVAVYEGDDAFPTRYQNGDVVKIETVLPGFATPVKAFFQ